MKGHREKIIRGAALLIGPLLLLILISNFVPSLSSQNQKKEKTSQVELPKLREKDLPQQYQDWLKLVSYIILPVEKEVFMKLQADRDRDIFIESFWKQRDPTPGTLQNEYKDEIIKRFQYANNFIKRGATREGWMTDMGRIHIILGPPASIERFEGVSGILPCQVWYYRGEKEKGLPGYFAIVFYQRGGSGEFKLYNPASDGPASLLIDTKGVDLTDPQQLYQKIKDFAPTLAGVSISMIPGEYPFNYQASPQANIIFSNIFQSPKKDISSSYATHFLEYKGIVSTEYLTNYIESNASMALVEDPFLGITFLHFSLSPKKMSIDYYQPRDQYYCNFKISVSLRSGENIVYQYSKDYPFYFPPENAENIRANGIAVQDSFPIIEGRYGLTILLQNSVGKEFSVFEKEVVIPAESNAPQIVGPVLGYKLQENKTVLHVPFKAMDKQISVDSSNTFSAGDDLALFFNVTNLDEATWKEGKVEVEVKGLREKNPFQKSFTLKLADYPFNRILGISSVTAAREFIPDYYEMKLSLKDGRGKALDEAAAQFIISPAEALPHSVTLAKSFPLSNNYLYFYSLAYQYDRMNEPQKAEANFQKAYELKPDYAEGIVEYANFLLKIKKFDRALEMAEKFKENEKLKFEYFLVKGQAQAGKGAYPEAIESLLEGNKIYNSDTRLLNTLGFCYYKTAEKKKAREVLNASLRLNPEQPDIRELIAEVEKLK
jgi:GWxTD domain-containing protein